MDTPTNTINNEDVNQKTLIVLEEDASGNGVLYKFFALQGNHSIILRVMLLGCIDGGTTRLNKVPFQMQAANLKKLNLTCMVTFNRFSGGLQIFNSYKGKYVCL